MKKQYRLQLCDGSSSASYGALQCYYRSSGCTGANGNNCYPNIVWASTPGSSGYYYYRNLNSGTFNENTNPSTKAFGVRCVLDLKKSTDSSATGIQVTVPCSARN